MPNPQAQQTAQQLRQALDRIVQVKNDPAQIQQAVNQAKQQIEQLVQALEQD